MAMKHCSQCFEVLPANNGYFTKNKRVKSGLSAMCKKCNVDKVQQYNQRNIENRKEYYRNYYRMNKEKVKKYNTEYYERNKDVIKENSRIYHSQYRDVILKKKRDYYKSNKAEIYEAKKRSIKRNKIHYKILDAKHAHIRRQNKKVGVCTLKSTEWTRTLKYFNHQCAYCGSAEYLEQDHVIPVSRGGHYTPDNIIPACRSCNASKNNKIMQDWFTQHENYSVERMANILKYVQKNKTEVNI